MRAVTSATSALLRRTLVPADTLSEGMVREFETSDRHLEHRQKLHPFRSGGSMTTMQVVAHLAGAGL